MLFIHDLSVYVSEEQVLYQQGIANRSRICPKIEVMYHELLPYLDDVRLLELAISYEFRTVTEVRLKYLCLEGGTIIRGSALSKRLPKASEVGAIVCTVGAKLEEKVSDHSTKVPG